MKFKDVVKRQRAIAISRPCEEAEQCMDPRYLFVVHPAQGLRCGVVLTVNVGEE